MPQNITRCLVTLLLTVDRDGDGYDDGVTTGNGDADGDAATLSPGDKVCVDGDEVDDDTTCGYDEYETMTIVSNYGWEAVSYCDSHFRIIRYRITIWAQDES